MKKIIFVLVLLCAVLLIIFLIKSPSGSGTIKLLTPDATVVLQQNSLLSDSIIELTPKKPEIQAKVGTYSARFIALKKKDGTDTWEIITSGNFGELENIKVRKGQITELNPGPPFTVKTIVQRQGSTVSVGLDIVGSAGEQYSPTVRKNKSQPAAPKLKIVNEKGEIVASGKFAYG